MTRVGADDEHPPLPLDQLAIFTNPLDARTHFHGKPLSGKKLHESQGIFHCRDARTRDKVHFADFLPFRFDLLDATCGTIVSRTHLLNARNSVVSSVVSL